MAKGVSGICNYSCALHNDLLVRTERKLASSCSANLILPCARAALEAERVILRTAFNGNMGFPRNNHPSPYMTLSNIKCRAVPSIRTLLRTKLLGLWKIIQGLTVIAIVLP